jgi:hypothetical protein
MTRAGAATGGTVSRSNLRWTTEVISAQPSELQLRIVDGPMRGTVTYHIEPSGSGSLVTIRNTREVPGFAPRA